MNLSELKLLTERPKIQNQKGTGQACKALTFNLNAFLWTIFVFFLRLHPINSKISVTSMSKLENSRGKWGHMEPLSSSGWQRQSFNRF